MKRLLLVDDEPLLLEMYQEGLAHHGYQVETAEDGLAAIKALRTSKPDLMILDLKMPKLSGVDVLKFVRSQPDLAALPVVVLSNFYMEGLAQDVAAIGIQDALLKLRCTPAALAGAIQEILEGKNAGGESTPSAAKRIEPVVPEQKPPPPASPAGTVVPYSGPTLYQKPLPPPAEGRPEEGGFKDKARRGFLETATTTCATMRNLFQAAKNARSETERSIRLQDCYHKAHFVAATAEFTECPYIARMAGVLEAMLFEVRSNPAQFTPSVTRTTALAIDFLETLFQHARGSHPGAAPTAHVLVVDDDASSNRFVVSALRHAHFQASSTENPLEGLQWLQEKPYDLVLLDLEMPGIGGYDLYQQLRMLPGYQQTPVIFLASQGDFENRSQDVLSSANDLISKPIFPAELAVKVVMHVLEVHCRAGAQPWLAQNRRASA